MVEHPGGLQCRFIRVEKGAYLEFCQITDWQQYKVFSESDSGKSLSEKELLVPGLSLRSNSGLKDFYTELKNKNFEVEFEHKNYDWLKDQLPEYKDRPIRLGWNFVTFEKPLIDTVFAWITEYERDPNKKKASVEKKLTHENTVTNFVGFIFSAKTRMEKFSTLVDADRQPHDLSFDNKKMIFVDKNKFAQGLFKDKYSDYLAIILKAQSLKAIKQVAQPDQIIELHGKETAVLKLKDFMWDIVVVVQCS